MKHRRGREAPAILLIKVSLYTENLSFYVFLLGASRSGKIRVPLLAGKAKILSCFAPYYVFEAAVKIICL